MISEYLQSGQVDTGHYSLCHNVATVHVPVAGTVSDLLCCGGSHPSYSDSRPQRSGQNTDIGIGRRRSNQGFYNIEKIKPGMLE